MKPARPSVIALSVAWPIPVNANEPCKRHPTPTKLNGEARIKSRKLFAATIGPIVCEDDGPIPILNMSNTETNIKEFLYF